MIFLEITPRPDLLIGRPPHRVIGAACHPARKRLRHHGPAVLAERFDTFPAIGETWVPCPPHTLRVDLPAPETHPGGV